MWSNLFSAALLYGVLSTTFVAGQANQASPTISPSPTFGEIGPAGPTGPPQSTTTGGSKGDEPGSAEKSGGDGPAAPSSTLDRPQNSVEASTNSARQSAGNSAAASSGKSNNTGAIAGGVVGGVLFLVLVGALIFFLRKKKRARDPFGSMEKSADERAASNESPSPLPPAPIAAASASPHPHHSPTTPNEAHALMSHYGDAQPQHIPQEVQPVIMPAKPYDVNPSSREIHDGDEDDDGVSINSPSPVTTPSPERQQEQQRSVPRLPIYQGGGRKDDVGGGNTPPPAL